MYKYTPGGRHIITDISSSNIEAAKTEASMVQTPDIHPIRSSLSMDKMANIRAKASSDITRTAPMFNDPRYTSSTLAIPPDSRTLHGLYRFFGETDPIVGAAIKMLAEMPLSDLRLGQCEDSGIQQHFEDMWERMNGFKMLSDLSQEYHEIGDVFCFGAWNNADYMWDQFAILNPDYVKVESTWVNQRPLIKLIPDETLRKVVQTKSPRFIYQQLPPEIIRYVLFNQEIPLDPNNVFQISLAKRPYEQRGKSIIKRILKTLMLEDRFNQANFALATRHAVPMMLVKVGMPDGSYLPTNEELDEVRTMMCYDSETEVLTDSGFKHYNEVNDKDKIACYNKDTDTLLYDHYTERIENEYDGEMLGFDSRNIDLLVTPNHRMLTRRKGSWIISRADEVYPKTDHFRSCIENYIPDNLPDKLENFNIKMEDWFAFAGWYLSEGGLRPSKNKSVGFSSVVISQYKVAKKKKEILSIIKRLNLPYSVSKDGNVFMVRDINFANFVYENLGHYSKNKKVPIWMMNAPKDLLESLFYCYIKGDGWVRCLKNSNKKAFGATTVSKRLSDDTQIIALKIGFSSFQKYHTNIYMDGLDGIRRYTRASGKNKGEPYSDKYTLSISNHDYSKYPGLYSGPERFSRNIVLPKIETPYKGKRPDWSKIDLKDLLKTFGSADAVGNALGISGTSIRIQMKKQNIPIGNPGGRLSYYDWSVHIHRVPYKGKIWCFTVPTGLMVVRRNGKISIQGNSNFELDPNFSLIWHAGINIEHVGSNGKMLPVGPELDRIYRLKFIGLGVHEQLLAGQGGSYASSYINMEVQRQRYLNYQLKIENFVHSGIFKTTADLCGFYRVKNAVASYSGVKASKFGNDNSNIMQKLGAQFKTLRDIQDNQEFKQFIKVKADEVKNMEQRQIREYVYPKLDWGSLSASTDENLKNFVKWLVDKRPHLVDDATLARLGRLDRDTQEKAYLEDLRRKQQRLLTISKEGLLPFMQDNKKGGGGPVDFGGIGDISMGGGGDMGGPGGSPEGMGGGEAPIGAGGPPESAGGQTPPAGFSGQLEQLQREVVGDILRDDMTLSFENKDLLNAKKIENTALLRKIDGTE